MTSQRVLRNAPGKQPPDCARPRICGRSCLSLWKPWAFSPTPRAGVRGLGEVPGSAGRSGRAELTGRPVLGFLEPVGSVCGAFWSRSRLQPRPPRTASGAVRCGSALPTHPGSLSGAHPAAPRVLAQDWGAPGVQIAGRDVSAHPPAPTNAPSGTSGNSKRKIESGAAPRSPLPGARFPPPCSESVIPFLKLAELEAVLGTRPV